MDEILEQLLDTEKGRRLALSIVADTVILETGKLSKNNEKTTREILRTHVGQLNRLMCDKFDFNVSESGTLSITKKETV